MQDLGYLLLIVIFAGLTFGLAVAPPAEWASERPVLPLRPRRRRAVRLPARGALQRRGAVMPTTPVILQLVVVLALLLVLARPLGKWLAAVAEGRLPRWLAPLSGARTRSIDGLASLRRKSRPGRATPLPPWPSMRSASSSHTRCSRCKASCQVHARRARNRDCRRRTRPGHLQGHRARRTAARSAP